MPRTLVVVALILGVLVAACGGGGNGSGNGASDATTATTTALRSFEGLFDGTNTTVESTVADDKDIGQEIRGFYALVCDDEACTRIYQRSSFGLDTRTGGTWLFVRDGTSLRATETSTGNCDGKPGTYRQEITWTWNVIAGGSMEGEIRQTFTGCERDATSLTKTTMQAQPTSESVGFAAAGEAERVAKALNDYDKAFAAINGSYQRCNEQVSTDGQVGDGVQCFVDSLTTWGAGLRALAEALAAGAPADAGEPCKRAWTNVPDPASLAGQVEAARDEFRRVAAEGGNLDRAMNELLPAALAANADFQIGVTNVGYACISPNEVDRLGDEGALVLDTNRALLAGDNKA